MLAFTLAQAQRRSSLIQHLKVKFSEHFCIEIFDRVQVHTFKTKIWVPPSAQARIIDRHHMNLGQLELSIVARKYADERKCKIKSKSMSSHVTNANASKLSANASTAKYHSRRRCATGISGRRSRRTAPDLGQSESRTKSKANYLNSKFAFRPS